MRHLALACLLALCALSAPSLWSQGGSNYSALGLGDAHFQAGGLYAAMGGTAIAMPSHYGINVVNPALLGRSVTTRLQVGYRFNQHVVRNVDDRILAQNNGELDGLLAMFSVDTARGFGVSFGILPFSNVAYKVRRPLFAVAGADTVVGRSEQDGSGGMSMLHLGASVRLLHTLHVGLQVNGLFGVLSYTDRVTADGPYNAVASSKSYDIRGLVLKGGFTWDPAPWLMVGGYVSAGSDGSVFTTRRVTGFSGASVLYDSTRIDEATTGLPVMVGLGISTPVGTGRLGADIELQDFTRVTVNDRPDASYTSSLRLSLGYTKPGPSTGSWWNQLGYHAGLSAQRLPVRFNGAPIYESVIAGGLSMPLGGNAMVDAGVQLGYRGIDAPGSDLDEFIGRLNVTVSIGEIWFRPFARE